MTQGPVTVHLLTGFLGSGKTTLLRRLLRRPDLAGTAVLINEFGEVGLDHLLVEEVDREVVLLKSGCVCCTIRGDLRDGLDRLLGRMRRGEVPPFRRVVVETTGIADPVPIVASFTADPALRYHFRLGAVVTVVDAVNGLATLDRHTEAFKQAAMADQLAISKEDLVGRADALRARLAALNPTAAIAAASDSLLLQARAPRSVLPAEHAPHRAGGPTTFCLTSREPLDGAVFGLWLSMLLNRHGGEILRLKGLLWMEGENRPVVIQGVQHLVHAPEHLDAWPDGEPATRLVVIGRGFDARAVRRSFAAFMGLGRGPAAVPSAASAKTLLTR